MFYEGGIVIDSIRQYLLCVITASIVCGIVIGFIKNDSAVGAIIKLLSGIFLAICAIKPLYNMNFSDFQDYWSGFSIEADSVTSEGVRLADGAIAERIKLQAESYILDKAASMDACVQVEITMSDTSPPVPAGIIIIGDVSPFTKAKLSKVIKDDLGISKEDQLWT